MNGLLQTKNRKAFLNLDKNLIMQLFEQTTCSDLEYEQFLSVLNTF